MPKRASRFNQKESSSKTYLAKLSFWLQKNGFEEELNQVYAISKFAVSKENQDLRDSFIEKFSGENERKAAAIADQWYTAYFGTEEYENWSDYKSLNDIIQKIKKAEPRAVKENDTPTQAERLSEEHPEHASDIMKLSPPFVKWIRSRWGKEAITEEIHSLKDSLVTLLRYQEKLPSLRQKLNSNESFKELFAKEFGNRQIQDIKAFSIDDMEKVIRLSERKKTTSKLDNPDYEPKEFIGQFGEWKLWMPLSREDSIYIAQFNRDTLEPDTTWCTARTSGSNLFYSYATSDTLLFYVIKDGASCQDTDAFQSIGWKDGEIIGREDGIMTVNRVNEGVSEEEHERIFGSQLDAIYKAIENKAEEIGGEHPAKEKFMAVALGDKEVYEDMIRGVEPDGVKAIDEEVRLHKVYAAKNPNASPETLSMLAKDSSYRTRMAVAKNPNTPLNTLRLLAKDREVKVRESVSKNVSITEDIIEMFLENEDPNGDILGGLAKNPSIPSKLLYQFAELSLQALQGVAENPSAPPDLLHSIAKKKSSTLYIRKLVAKNSSITQRTVDLLSNDKEPKVRAAIAGNPKCDESTLRSLASDADLGVRLNVAKSKNATKDILKKIVKDPVIFVAREVIKRNDISHDIISDMLKRNDFESNIVISSGSIATKEDLDKLASNKKWEVRQNVASNENTDPKTLNRLLSDPEGRVTWKVIENKNTSKEAILNASGEMKTRYLDYYVKQYNRKIDHGLARILVYDQSSDVRIALSEVKGLPEDVIIRLSYDGEEDVRGAIGALGRGVPDKVMKRLAQDKSPNVRLYISKRKDLTPDVVRILLKDPRDIIRGRLLSRRDDILDFFDTLSEENKKYVIDNNSSLYFSNPGMKSVVNDPSPSVRVRVAMSNKLASLDENLIRQLSQDEDFNVRGAIAKNVGTPGEILESLSKDPHPGVRIMLALRIKDLSPDIVERLVKDRDERIREFVKSQLT